MDETLQGKIQGAPTLPGCYVFYDKYGYVVYVGKAKNLRNRVKSYFTKAAAEDERTAELVPKIVDVEFRVMPSELDALMQEYHLIKRHKPWFNSQMKADKQRPYLRIATDERYPTLSATPTKSDDNAYYYDCFTDEEDIKATLTLLCQVWKVPRCGAASFRKSSSPCLYNAINGCLAPCTGAADAEACHAAVKEIRQFMAGHRVAKIPQLKKEMAARADVLEFEAAGQIRGQLTGLELLQRKSRKIHHFPETGSMLVLIRPFRETAFSVFYVRDGKALHRTDFPDGPNAAILSAFMDTWEADSPALEEWVTACLTEISADKAFVQLQPKVSAADIEREVWKFYAKR